MLRHSADVRTIAYLLLTASLSIVQWNLGHVSLPLYALSLFMAVTTAVISHNHNHLGIWKSRGMNLVTSYVISIYYGYPAIAWVPTHNQVHHKLNNKEGDSSRSPKYFKRNHLFALLVYPTLTGMAQTPEIFAYIRDLGKRDRKAYWMAISEFVVFFGFMAAMFLLSWKKALLFFLIPQQFALFTIQVFNYVQHVEADENSKWNHSRNFVSPVLNALLFNNGFHTVHHQKPGVHWSQTPALHAEVAKNIHPALLVKSWWGFMIYTFLLRPLIPGAKAPVLTEMSAADASTEPVAQNNDGAELAA
ncbi:MAG: fatty acid desaturase family protein [Myxococcaceae bacterium]